MCGGEEGEEEILGANGVVPDAGFPGTSGVVAEGLVDDVPRVTTVAKVGDEVGDVVDEDGAEGLVGLGGGGVGDPGGKLAVPDEIVAADEFAGGLGEVEEGIGGRVVEDALEWLGGFELSKCVVVWFW